MSAGNALRANASHVESPYERRGALIVLLGALFGLAPFGAASFFLAAGEETTTFLLVAVLPLALVPLTFAYAIVRFQVLDIQFILRRSLLYTVTTALVTGLYAVGIALVNVFFAGSSMATRGLWPFALALGVVLLFDPLRRRIQELLDRTFFAGRSRLQSALADLGEAMTAQLDLQAVVGDLVERFVPANSIDEQWDLKGLGAALKEEWREIVEAKSALFAYTQLEQPTRQDYLKAFLAISETLDNMRTVYANVGETDELIGLYPFAPLHDMRRALQSLDPAKNATASADDRKLARDAILQSFYALRECFLEELDLEPPDRPLLQHLQQLRLQLRVGRVVGIEVQHAMTCRRLDHGLERNLFRRPGQLGKR